jgi:hypothetical protein
MAISLLSLGWVSMKELSCMTKKMYKLRLNRMDALEQTAWIAWIEPMWFKEFSAGK